MKVEIRDLSDRKFLCLHTEGGSGEADGYKYRIITDCGLGGTSLYCTVRTPGGESKIFQVSGQDLLQVCMEKLTN